MSEKTDKLFNIYGYTGGSFSGNVYGINGISPTLNCMGGGNRMPMTLIEIEEMEPKIVGYTRDSKGKVVKRSLRDISNTVTTFTGSGCTTDMYAAEPKIAASRGRGEGWQQQLEINDGNKQYSPMTDGISNTLSTITKDNMLAVPELRMEDGCLIDKEGRKYRIRKLTPTECFRLQDVSDEDIEKMKQAGIAKTNLYKLAGNSIVVSCMYHLFRKLFIEKENENQQLGLF